MTRTETVTGISAVLQRLIEDENAVPTLEQDEEAFRHRLHELGLSDRDAARLCGITYRAFGMWRNARGLDRNHPIGGDRISHDARHARRERLRVAARLLEERDR